jgi:hypothetical protein
MTASTIITSSSVDSRSPASSAAIRSVSSRLARLRRRSAISPRVYSSSSSWAAMIDRQVLVEVAVEDAQHVRRPAAELLPVLLRRAEQLADDRDRVRLARCRP